ncbi:hypothetical protein [Chitinophaga pinensis]|uniref:Uncharacterized protein n=1 Tax=Chitinophaga pinensis TaxID=79329 RepID=A0A5C6LQ30_9BACT|nr:hypothetical protein [Chitinophaga pinensis]TWV98002.1 hypothetical protein FEF09_21510 [Chitinophaga pinensis]
MSQLLILSEKDLGDATEYLETQDWNFGGSEKEVVGYDSLTKIIWIKSSGLTSQERLTFYFLEQTQRYFCYQVSDKSAYQNLFVQSKQFKFDLLDTDAYENILTSIYRNYKYTIEMQRIFVPEYLKAGYSITVFNNEIYKEMFNY